MDNILSFIGGVLAACVVIALIMALHKLSEHEKELQQYRQAQSKRMRYDTLEGIEDAIAVMLTASRHLEEIEQETAAMESRINKANAILKLVRGGQYDPQTPSGEHTPRIK